MPKDEVRPASKGKSKAKLKLKDEFASKSEVRPNANSYLKNKVGLVPKGVDKVKPCGKEELASFDYGKKVVVFDPKPTKEDESYHFIDNGHRKRNLSLYLDEKSICKRQHNVGH